MKFFKKAALFVFFAVIVFLYIVFQQKPGAGRKTAGQPSAAQVQRRQPTPELPAPPAEPKKETLFSLADKYYFGKDGYEQDYNKAFELFTKVYQEEKSGEWQGHCANIALGNMYYNGQGVKKDVKKAIELWDEGDWCNLRDGNNNYSFDAYNNLRNYIIEHKDKDLAFYLGDSCFERFGYRNIQCGHASELDDDFRYPCEQGEKWYKLAAEYGHPEAMVRLADNYLINANIHHNCYTYFNGDWSGTEEEHQYRYEGEQLLLSAAKQGYVDAWQELGKMYFYGYLPMNHKKAEEWYLKAANKGKGPSAMMLARLYSGGEDSAIPADYQKAFHWATQAVQRGVKEANYYLGMLYYNGKGVAKDRHQALRLFKNVPDEGSYEYLLAGNMLQTMYLNGEGTEQDFKNLGSAYERCYYYYCPKGWLFGKDAYKEPAEEEKEETDERRKEEEKREREKAIWQAAFERNDILAQLHLMQQAAKDTDEAEKQKSLFVLRALIALHPEPKDPTVKKEWQSAKEAVAQDTLKDDTQAQRKIGAEYVALANSTDDYKTKDPYLTKAFEWYTLAARLGDDIAQTQLSSMYWIPGIGTYHVHFEPNTVPEEVYWLKKAAAQGNRIAQYELANKYYRGVLFTDEQGAIYSQSLREIFMVRNLPKAFELYKKSAEAGYAPAMKKLSRMYELGESVYPDYSDAAYWKGKAEKATDEKTADEAVNFYTGKRFDD